jgi:hypothetical protein
MTRATEVDSHEGRNCLVAPTALYRSPAASTKRPRRVVPLRTCATPVANVLTMSPFPFKAVSVQRPCPPLHYRTMRHPDMNRVNSPDLSQLAHAHMPVADSSKRAMDLRDAFGGPPSCPSVGLAFGSSLRVLRQSSLPIRDLWPLRVTPEWVRRTERSDV